MRIAVIGGGIAGLVAANLLADAGMTVTVYESADALGGRGRSSHHDGGILNIGPHAIYIAGAAYRQLGALGVDIKGGSPDLSQFQLLLDGTLVRAPVTPWSMLSASYLTLRERADLTRFMSRTLGNTDGWNHVSFEKLVDDTTQSQRVREILWMSMSISTYSRSGRASAGAVLRQLRRAMANVIYPDGGWQSIVDQLEARALGNDVKLHLAEPARSVEGTHVTTTRGEASFDAIVFAVDPSRVERLTGKNLGNRRATRMASLDLVLDDEEEPNCALESTFDVRTGVYLSVHSEVADLGPAIVVHAAKYLDPFAEQDQARDRADIEHLLDRVAPNWRTRVRFSRFLPSLIVNHWFPDAESGGEPARPAARLDERWWIAGDWVGDEGLLLDAAVASAARCAAEIDAIRHRSAAAS